MAASFDPATVRTAVRHLGRRDPVMRAVIAAVGPFALSLDRDRFRMLVRSIIAQQISWSAARSIRARLDVLAGPGGVKPETLAGLSIKQLRSVGLSPQKAGLVLLPMGIVAAIVSQPIAARNLVRGPLVVGAASLVLASAVIPPWAAASLTW